MKKLRKKSSNHFTTFFAMMIINFCLIFLWKCIVFFVEMIWRNFLIFANWIQNSNLSQIWLGTILIFTDFAASKLTKFWFCTYLRGQKLVIWIFFALENCPNMLLAHFHMVKTWSLTKFEWPKFWFLSKLYF